RATSTPCARRAARDPNAPASYVVTMTTWAATPSTLSANLDHVPEELERRHLLNLRDRQVLRRAMANAARWTSMPSCSMRLVGTSSWGPATCTADVGGPSGSGTGAATDTMPISRSPRACE